MRYLSILFIFLFILSSPVYGQELTSADQYADRGIARFQNNDLEGAIQDFTKAIEMKGQQLEFCHYFRGMAHYRKGNVDQAVTDLSKAIELKSDPRFYDDRANLFAKKGDLDQALADLNKAIELAPQYAKAYGDRGTIHLLRGENARADSDFKKCFELDHALESHFKAAADKIKQRALSGQEEKPADVEVTSSSWTESPSKILIAQSSQAIAVTTTAVSASGTRVLADPSAKGQPGPPEIADASGVNGPAIRESKATTRDVMEYKFNVSIKNTSGKTIAAVRWAYIFEPKDVAHERLAYLFDSKTNIKPGKEKSLSDSVFSAGPKAATKLPHKNSQAFFIERVSILRIDYSDGSSWQSSDTTQKTTP